MITRVRRFTDFDTQFVLSFDGDRVRIIENDKTIYDGRTSDLVATGEYHAITVGKAVAPLTP